MRGPSRRRESPPHADAGAPPPRKRVQRLPCRLLSEDFCVRRDFMVPQHRARRMSVEDVMKDVMGGRRAMNAPESGSEASDISDISD